MVGARRATPYGLAAARLLAGWAAESGYLIYSGGALGCDQAAHRAALEAGGRTVAVMAGGPDVVYPRRSGALRAAILERGAVVSEHPPGTQPQRWTFRTRNRIIAGLARVLLVLEASLPSGTFTTAEYAADSGRTVAVVPGSIFAPECRGANRLLRTGAFPITDASELRDLLHAELGPPPRAASPWTGPEPDDGSDRILAALRARPAAPRRRRARSGTRHRDRGTATGCARGTRPARALPRRAVRSVLIGAALQCGRPPPPEGAACLTSHPSSP